MLRILLIDDDVELCQMMEEYLGAEDFSLTIAHDGEEGARLALSGEHDLVVLDVMMPRFNGFDTLRLIRASSQIPVIMLTAKGDEIDRIVGLELGADDYLSKPFNPRELVARLRAIQRRVVVRDEALQNHHNKPSITRVGKIAIYPSERIIEWKGEPLDITTSEYALLEVLARHAGHVVSKAELFTQALGRAESRYDRSVDVHVSNLRQKLGLLEDGRSPIQTVRGVGYQFIAG
ncbi:response regulator transcription factor [Methylobacillus flagellatus]|uniref:Two component transcriptional regulator, winged helix family n=1 Tax=Methylobacillus flagellatus (strain ATCC 51484 / DSM 6875 / VKM B-1610 / KT) TaxID=265072 RepID=Q1H3F3_METFK|nr:two component transcriptional regulator, winged helix family [Methylobacillus flagellatus KT]